MLLLKLYLSLLLIFSMLEINNGILSFRILCKKIDLLVLYRWFKGVQTNSFKTWWFELLYYEIFRVYFVDINNSYPKPSYSSQSVITKYHYKFLLVLVLGWTVLFVATFLFPLKPSWQCVGFNCSRKNFDQLSRLKFLICEPV